MALKRKTFKGRMENAYGKKLETPIDFSGDYDAYGDILDVKAANDMLNDKETLTVRNAERKAKAVAAARTAALDAAGIIKPNTENDPQLRLKAFYKLLRQSKKTHEEAIKLAALNVGVEWTEEPEDESEEEETTTTEPTV